MSAEAYQKLPDNQLPAFAIIMAGGKGTRLWPLSREALPKQFLALREDGQSLLQATARRAVQVLGSLERVLVVTQADQGSLVREQLPGLPLENLILEPASRNTAACLGLAALNLRQRSPRAIMAVLPADHLFEDETPWIRAVRTAIDFASRNERLVTIGIRPSFPSTAYGYIKLNQQLSDADSVSNDGQAGYPVYEVQRFIEKPDFERAQSYFESGDYLWNTGTFAWQLTVFQEALERYLPRMYARLETIADSPKLMEELYPGFEKISIDYGVMEKVTNAAVVQADFRRIDVGTLANLYELWPDDANGNAVMGTTTIRDSRKNIVYADEGLVGLIGVKDLIVIRRKDVVLVCQKERAAEVKALVNALDQVGLEQYR